MAVRMVEAMANHAPRQRPQLKLRSSLQRPTPKNPSALLVVYVMYKAQFVHRITLFLAVGIPILNSHANVSAMVINAAIPALLIHAKRVRVLFYILLRDDRMKSLGSREGAFGGLNALF